MIKSLHRYLGLAACLFWLAQALTGMVLVFQWELDDATLPGPRAPLDVDAVGARIAALALQGGRVHSLWAAGESADRFDIYYERPLGSERVMRVDGAGHVLRDRSGNSRLWNGAVYGQLSAFHQTLLAGAAGSWIIGISGILLCTNLLLGLKLAWPRAGQWRRLLTARFSGPVITRRYAVHQWLGAWISLPALLVVGSGTLLVFQDGAQELLHSHLAMPLEDAPVSTPVRIPFGVARRRATVVEVMSLAVRSHPGARLSALVMPDNEHPWWRLRLRTAADVPRIWGATTVFVAEDGGIIDAGAARDSLSRRLLDGLYPLHTGQIGGYCGRFGVFLTGGGLISLLWFGIRLWLARRARRRSGDAAAPPLAPLASVQGTARRTIVE